MRPCSLRSLAATCWRALQQKPASCRLTQVIMNPRHPHHVDIPARHLMAFADGENFVGRFEDMKQGQTPRAEIVHRPGAFLEYGFPGSRFSQGRALRAELDS